MGFVLAMFLASQQTGPGECSAHCEAEYQQCIVADCTRFFGAENQQCRKDCQRDLDKCRTRCKK